MQTSVNLVLGGRSLRSVATENGLCFQTLARYVKKQRDAGPEEQIRMKPNYAVNKVFTDVQEDQLASCIITCAKMFYGLSVTDICKLAKEFAEKNGVKYPSSWDTNNQTGLDWYYRFMARHKDLSLRTPEGRSLWRARSFNKHTAGQFFKNLKDVFTRYPELSDGTRIYNLDETVTSIVQEPQRGINQENTVSSGEKGAHFTTCCFINASGNSIPPVIIFPRVHCEQNMLASK